MIIDHAIPDETLAAARDECVALTRSGAFTPTDQHSASLRSDSIMWLSEEEATSAGSGLSAALGCLRGVASRLDDGGCDGWEGFAGGPRALLGVTRAAQLACYRAMAGGGSGVKDVDGTDGADAVAAREATGGARYRAHRDGIATLGPQVYTRLLAHATRCGLIRRRSRMRAAAPHRLRPPMCSVASSDAGDVPARDIHA